MLSASARHYVSIDPIVRGGTRRGTPPPDSAVLNSWSMTLVLPARAMQKGTLVMLSHKNCGLIQFHGMRNQNRPNFN